MSDAYEVKLGEFFEGPMDLLVHLIKKNDIDVYDIPIALITEQYLEYIELIKSMNINIAGEFLLMAATLTQIKSRMLLPVHEKNEEDEDEDPRIEITKPLLQYLQIKTAAEDLIKRNILGEDIFIREPDKSDFMTPDEDEILPVGLFELIDAFQKIIKTISPDLKVDMTAETMSVKDKIADITAMLEEKQSITFDDLFTLPIEKKNIVVTFLAVLEMVKLNLIKIVQHIPSGIIRLFYL